MANLTKRELAIRISKKTGISQIAVKEVIQKTLDYIVESLQKGQNVELRNFGVFTVKNRKARTGRNPNKPQEVVTIPAKKVAYFKPGRVMKKIVGKTL
ncbi:MAG: integration host factor subunit beta [Candidatus Aureabacteria bacterium]|nr:integration host factor subunit beta [Candidatus Auribacterota bacterium]